MSSIAATSYPPPADLPVTEVKYLLGYLGGNGQAFSRQQTVHAIGVIALYANSKIPDGDEGPLAIEDATMPLADRLTALLPAPDGTTAFTLPPMYKALLAQLVKLLLDKFLS